MKFFEKKGRKAAISIFLTIILIPSLLLSAVLIDGSRVASAKAIVQEASDLAVVSALADYNLKLKQQFGLFAINKPEDVDKIYKESLNATLMAYGLDDAEYSEMIWGFMKEAITGTESLADASFLNLYDFQVDSNATKAEALYPLAEKEVLKTQMVEHAKFRGIYVVLDRLDILTKLGEAKKQAEDNVKSADEMEEKMDIDESNASADSAIKKLREEIDGLMSAAHDMDSKLSSYVAAVRARMEVLRYENTYPQDENGLNSITINRAAGWPDAENQFYESGKKLKEKAENVLDLAEKANTEAVKAVGRLDDFKQGKSENGNTVEGKLNSEAQKNREAYQNYVDETKTIMEDRILDYYAHVFDPESLNPSSLLSVPAKIEEAISKDIDRIERLKEEFEAAASEDDGEDADSEDEGGEGEEEEEFQNSEYYYYYIDSDTERSQDGNYMVNMVYQPEILEKISSGRLTLENLQNVSWKNIEPNSEPGNQNKISEDFASQQSKKKADGSDHSSTDGEAIRGEIEEAVYAVRPSVSYKPDSGKSAKNGFYNTNGDLSGSKSIMSQGKDNMLLQLGETVRDDVLSLSYMFGTFKTRLTGVEKFTSSMPQSDRTKYMPAWRYEHPDGELDMRFEPKKKRDTVLRGEIEYLIYGMRTDEANEGAVYATIYAERMVNNMIALYLVDNVNTACHAAAAVSSALLAGIVPEPVFFWIFLTAWSVAETFLDMDYLLKGYRIPLVKTTNNVLLGDIPTGTGLIDNYGEPDDFLNNGLFVSYEDYLLIMLLLAGDEKRIMRSADLIEMNMNKNKDKNKQENFAMAKAFTYIKADTSVSLRYLFGEVMPFSSSYEEKGYSGRLKFSSSIYMGY